MPRWQSQSDGFTGAEWKSKSSSLFSSTTNSSGKNRWKSQSSGWSSSGSRSTPSLTTLAHNTTSPKFSFRGGSVPEPGKGRPQSSPDVPAPNTYFPQPPRGNAPSFGSSARGGLVGNGNPGPGDYTVESSFSRKGMRMGPKLDPPKEKSDSVPGPGAYGDIMKNRQEKRSKALRRNGFGSALRKSFSEEAAKTNASPGPGIYLPGAWPRGPPPQNSSFGASNRKDMSVPSCAPPPGTYEAKSYLREGPKWTTTQKAEEKNDTEGLGPASYTLPSSLNKRSFTIPGKPEKKQKDDGPAPDAYNVVDISGSKPKGKSIKFGKATRGPPEDIEPFEYPGPGWYRPKHPGDARILEASLGKSARAVGEGSKATGVGSARPWYLDGPCTNLDVPGPTAYETSTNVGGPQITISVKLDDATVRLAPAARRGFEKKDKVPGPGAYDPSLSGDGEAHQTVFSTVTRPLNVDKGEGPARPWYLDATYAHPGPGAYRPERYEKNKIGDETCPTGPRFGASLKARVRQGRPPDETPGPGAHGPAATQFGV